MNYLKPCPLCGKELDIEDPDTMHPSSVGWVVIGDFKSYVNRRETPSANECWEINCCKHYGGCGLTLTEDSKDEVISRWNLREDKPMSTLEKLTDEQISAIDTNTLGRLTAFAHELMNALEKRNGGNHG